MLYGFRPDTRTFISATNKRRRPYDYSVRV